jgi:DNA-binding LacI/PurR family transcriptional regulator
MIGISEKAASLRFPLNFFFGKKLVEYQAFFDSINDASHSGLITYPFHGDVASGIGEIVDKYKERGGQIIVLNTDEKYQRIPVLRIDDRLGGQAAAKELIATGCRIFLVDNMYSERAKGCCDYLESKGMTGLCFQRNDFENVFKTVSASKKDGPIGIFATTDNYALELYPRLQEAGLIVGQDVCVIGYDDLVLTETVTPSLSTIHQPFREQGERAVEKLINMIYGKTENDEIIKPWLVKRQSTGHSSV